MRFEYEVGVWRYIGTVEETSDGIRVSDFLVFNRGVPHEVDSEEYDEAEELFLYEYWRQK